LAAWRGKHAFAPLGIDERGRALSPVSLPEIYGKGGGIVLQEVRLPNSFRRKVFEWDSDMKSISIVVRDCVYSYQLRGDGRFAFVDHKPKEMVLG